jgi:hypothetical protein
LAWLLAHRVCDALLQRETKFARLSQNDLCGLRDRTFEEQVNKYAAIWKASRPTGVVVASVNLAPPDANGPGMAVPPQRGSAPAELASQTAAETPVAAPLPPPVRNPAAAEPALQSGVAPLPPHRPPQLPGAIPRAVAP